MHQAVQVACGSFVLEPTELLRSVFAIIHVLLFKYKVRNVHLNAQLIGLPVCLHALWILKLKYDVFLQVNSAIVTLELINFIQSISMVIIIIRLEDVKNEVDLAVHRSLLQLGRAWQRKEADFCTRRLYPSLVLEDIWPVSRLQANAPHHAVM